MNGSEPVKVDDTAPADEPARSDDGGGDGRTARSAKTRNAIADALLDLLGDGAMRPTAREIAERAGVSVRSVYVHFDDLDDLFCVAARRNFERLAPLLAPIATTGPLADRAAALVQQRIRLYTNNGAVARATRLNAAFSPTLARLLRDAHALARTELERVFGHELEQLGRDQRANTLAILDVLTGADAWETLLRRNDLSPDDAMHCVTQAVVLQLAGGRAS